MQNFNSIEIIKHKSGRFLKQEKSGDQKPLSPWNNIQRAKRGETEKPYE